MAKATAQTTRTRRRLPKGPPETTAEEREVPAGILSLCAEFDALQSQKRPLFDTILDDDAREFLLQPIDVLQEPIVYRLAELRATTLEEHRARARSLWTYQGQDQLNEDANSHLWDARLTAAILRDLAEPAVAEAALLELCRQFDADTRVLQRHNRLTGAQRATNPTLELAPEGV